MTAVKAIGKLIGLGILFFVILEIAARTDDYINWDAPFFSNYAHENLSVLDQYGWHNRPNTQFQKWHVNSYGFRGDEVSIEPADSVIRIICVGASATFGLFETENMEYPAQMQAMLDAEHPGKYEIINAACPGMSPIRIAYYYNHWLNQFKPDIITYYPASDFYLNDFPPSMEVRTSDEPTQPSTAPRLMGKMRIALKGFIPYSWQSKYKQYKMQKYIDSKPADWIWNSPPQERLDLYREHLTYFVNEIQNGGAKVILSTKANSISNEMNATDRFNVTNWRSYHARATEDCLLEMDNVAAEIIKELGQELSIPVADIAPNIPKSSEYFADSGHFTDKGATIAARKMVEKILEITAIKTAY